jgi:trehalose 6-phosphate synthase/phosphatase
VAHWASPPFRRLIFVSNHLPLIAKRDEVSGWTFEWDEDALIAQAKEGLPGEFEAVYVGCLSVEVEGHEQDVRET